MADEADDSPGDTRLVNSTAQFNGMVAEQAAVAITKHLEEVGVGCP